MPKPSKTYYRIREVAALLDIPDYTLRFWEDEFPMLITDRTPGGQRRYTSEQVELVKHIKELLYNKGLKINAAIKILNKTYRKYPPRNLPLCKSPIDALRLLEVVKDSLEDAHAVAKIEAVEGWIKQYSD